MARATPVIRDTKLYHYDEHEQQEFVICDIVEDWTHWQTFLERESEAVFRFSPAVGTGYSVRKELRPHFGRPDDLRPLWYAHKRLAGRLHRRYIGKSENCTYEKLKAVALEFSREKHTV
jgi:hypothetical protein